MKNDSPTVLRGFVTAVIIVVVFLMAVDFLAPVILPQLLNSFAAVP